MLQTAALAYTATALGILVCARRQRRPAGKRGLRAACRTDVDAVVAINKAIALETEGCELPDAGARRGAEFMLDDAVAGLRPRCWVWEECGRVVGMICISPEWSDWWGCEYWWIPTIYVEPAHRRKGIATALLGAVKEAADRERVQTVNLRVERDNATAQALYRRVGFAVDDSHLVMAYGRTPSGAAVGE